MSQKALLVIGKDILSYLKHVLSPIQQFCQNKTDSSSSSYHFFQVNNLFIFCNIITTRYDNTWFLEIKSFSHNNFFLSYFSVSFHDVDAVYYTGIFGVISCICLGLFCILSVLQIAMVSARDKVVMKYSVLVVLKLVLVTLAGM